MMKNKLTENSIFLLTMLIIVALFANIVLASNIIPDKNIRISMVNQEPDPVESGNYVTVRFKLENYGSKSTAPIVIGIKEKFPFTILDNNFEQNIGNLRGMQRTSDSKIVKWDLRVDRDAMQGLNEIVVYYMELEGQNAKVIYEQKFFIDVRVSDTILSLVDIKNIPEKLSPGQKTELVLTLENKGQSSIKDVSIDLDLYNTDITTLGSSSQKIIQRIDGKQKMDVSFILLSDSSAELRAHQIPITLKYKDDLNNEYSHQSTFGFMLESDIEYIINVDDSDIITTDKTGDVNLRISNKGLNNIRFLSMELKPSLQYEILSSPIIYIGRIDSDDFDTVSYKIHALETDSNGIVNLRFLLTFKDNYNNDFVVEEGVDLQLFSPNEIKKYGLDGDSNSRTLLIIIIIIVILGIIYYIHKKRKKKKLEKEKSN
jgi:hypothetical protein